MSGAPMTRDEWLGWIQEFIEERIKDAPDETCRTIARNLWDETANLDLDEDDGQ